MHRQLLPRRRQRWALWLCVAGLVLVLGPAVARLDASSPDASPTNAIGRLIVDSRGVCTAFLVKSEGRRASNGAFTGTSAVFDNWVVTAGHCLGNTLLFQQGLRTYHTHVVGFSGGGRNGYDVMILEFMTPYEMPTLELAFGEYPATGDPLMLIGYGSKALLMRVGPLVRYNDRGHMEIHSYASRGNSGGPVLIPGTRRVVGVGIETTLDKPVGASMIYCLMAGCAVKPPYVATHVDRLRGLASFSW